jgi:trans-aconitate 2-methyltransferase
MVIFNSAQSVKQVWNPRLYEQNHAFVWQYGEEVIQLLAPQAGERILDLGCGTGQLTAKIAETAEVLGLDHSEQMIAKAKANYPELAFTVADARNFSVEQPFDAVFSNAALHWMREADAVIQCVYQALKPGGRFVVESGGKGDVQLIITALNQALLEIGAAEINLWYFPSISEYATRLEQQGFEVLYAVLFDRPTKLSDGEAGLANWLNMFAVPLQQLSPEQHQQVLQSVVNQLRPMLYRDGSWIADYRRIRFLAQKI